MVTFLIDVNLPRRLVVWADGSCEFVRDHSPLWTDSQIWDYASAYDLTIVTRDADFSYRAMLTDVGPRVIHLKLRNMKLPELRRFLLAEWPRAIELSRVNRIVTVYPDRIECVS